MTFPMPTPEVSKVTIQKSLARFATIRVGAARQYPFLGQGIYAMIPRPVPGLSQKCGGWAMDKYGRCYFDPEMILGLGEEQYSVQTLIADFIHEVWHWIRRHPERFDMFSPPVGMEKDCKRWNIAADAEINGADKFLRDYLQEWCVFPEKLKGTLGHSLPQNQIAEWYYLHMAYEEEEDGESPGENEGREPGECLSDKKRPWEDGPPSDEEPGTTAKQGESIRKQIARDIQESSEMRGVGTVWMEWAKAQLSPPTVPWQEVVRRFAKNSMEISVGASDYTFRRRSRRQHAVQGNVLIPAVFHPKLRIGVVLDTSGSMSNDDLTRCLSEIDGIARAAGGSCFTVTGDTEAGWSGYSSSGRSVEIRGRGGTDMRPLIAQVEKENPAVHCTIVLSDGYTPWPLRGECKIPTMVALVGNHCGAHSIPGWMKSVIIKGNE
tara:strand:+ start:4111 stop:5415 length:1305 start_codon:yes stop_codon:yes gene_type:complete